MTSPESTPPRRIAVIGPSAAGKTTLALELCERFGLPAIHLDLVAEAGRDDPSTLVTAPGVQHAAVFVPRPLDERIEMVERLAAEPAWVAEGAFIGWTEPLFARADRIVWLDHVSYPTTVRRVLGRVRASTGEESTRHEGVRRYVRPAAFVRHGIELALELWDLSGYFRSRRRRPDVERDIAAARWDRLSRRAVAEGLRRHGDKVIVVRDEADLAGVVDRLAGASSARQGQPAVSTSA